MTLSSSLDFYSILGLSHNATTIQIEEAYRAAVRRFHPDVNSHPGAALQFKDIQDVYQILRDSIAHEKYRRERVAFGKLPGINTLCTASKRVLSVIEEPQILYVLLEVHAKRLKESAVKPQRAPLNLALVLDRSKSMGGERLARVKVAAHRIIEELQPIDRLSIITFSDTADVIVPSTFVTNVTNLKAPISLMVADGATEIFKALDASYRQVLGHYNPDAVNHIILVTDGRTYGDEEKSLELASQAASKGIAISALGIGDEWNDKFLDDLTSRTGGAVSYISAPSQVVGFLNAHVRNLTEAFAERLVLTIAPEPDVEFESAFRLAPTAQPLGSEQSLQLGVLDVRRPVMVMLQFQMPARLKEGFRPFVRLDVTGDVLSHSQRVQVKSINDLSTETSATPPVEIPPANVVEALSKMTLHRMQQKAEEAIAAGDVQGATRRLENLATRLLELGQVELAQQAGDEARRVRQTSVLSEEGRRALKYGTRALYPISINNHKE